jgi:LmbE family N-acetylglucosaminyl deacetylase
MNGLPSKIKRVLAVGAHPDDLEILCSGTLARYVQQGVQVSMAVATDGGAGHMVIPPAELAQIRRKEAEQAAQILGAESYWLGFHDEMIFEDIQTRMVFIDLIRRARPDLILTHAPNDYHQDHRIVSRLVLDASFISGLPHIPTDHPAHPGVQPVIYFDTVSGANFLPGEYVDISETFSIKRKMLECHASQLTWLKEHDNIDILDFIYIMARSRGLQCGVEYAEAFRSEQLWPRIQTTRLLP